MKEAARGPAARQGGRFFREPALAACASGVAVGYLWLLFAQLAWNSSGIGADGKNCRDFTWIWLAGRIAVAFLVRDAIARGFLAGERLILLLCCAALILLGGPIPAIACAVLVALVVRRLAGASGAPVWQLQGQRL